MSKLSSGRPKKRGVANFSSERCDFSLYNVITYTLLGISGGKSAYSFRAASGWKFATGKPRFYKTTGDRSDTHAKKTLSIY